jgi:ubiquitin-conjugating enzyme E2 M
MADRTPAPNAACLLRLQKDLTEIDEFDAVLRWPDPRVLQHFIARVLAGDGIWRGHKFDFDFQIPDAWPIAPPKIKILTPIWHPNITPPPEGAICLNILQRNYSACLTVSNMIVGLQSLFGSPNAQDPRNVEAASQYLQNYPAFKMKAEEFMQSCPKD